MQLVVGHANPDFDAYAATVAGTKLFPGAKGVFLGSQNDNVREFHNLHQDLLEFADLKGLDLGEVVRVIMVDTRDPGRIGELGKIVTRPDVDVVVYDHHPAQDGDIEGAEDRSISVGATTSILVHEIRERGIALSRLEASVMLLGIHEDTGSLTYPGATAYDADAAAFLMAAGADLEVVNQFLVRTLSAEQRGLLDQLLGTLEVWEVNGQQVAVGVAELEEYVDSAAVVTHYISEDMGYRVVVVAIQMPDRVYLVGRSRRAEVDMGQVMKALGGGGHAQAASAARRDLDVHAALSELSSALKSIVRPPLTAEQIASSPVRVVDCDMPMSEAGKVMVRYGHGGLPVIEEGRIVGIVTRKDVDKAARHGLGHAPVKGFMMREIISVRPDADVTELERLLTRAAIGRLPVMKDGELIGIVTRKDLLRAEHGDAYLDRGLPHAGGAATKRFLKSYKKHLPAEVRRAIELLGDIAEERGVRAHVVGGFVRDMLLGRPNLDVDIVVEGDGVEFAEEVASAMGVRVKVHRRFGTAVVVFSRELHIDVTSARSEYYARPGALPTVERSSLRQDLWRRDFSINAMAACVDPGCFGAIADPFGGLRDVERGVVRVLHAMSFIEDPTRVLRAARFESRYGFRMDEATESLARQCVELGLIDEVSGARIREELIDILDEEPAAPAFRRLAELGALRAVGPIGMDAERCVELVERIDGVLERPQPHPAPVVRRWTIASAFAGCAPAREVERWLRRLRLPKEAREVLSAVAERSEAVAGALRDRRGMRDSRLYAILTPLPSETLVYLSAAVDDDLARERLERFTTVLSAFERAISGRDLVEMGYAPSPAFASVLAQARADRLDGRAVGREAELANLARLAEKAGLKRADEAGRAPAEES